MKVQSYPVNKILLLVERQMKEFKIPWVTEVSQKKSPYKVLISCLLSLRTKDKTTEEACRRLFKVASTPKKMIKIPLLKLEKIIYPVGFYRNKAKVIRNISKRILEEFKGKVPHNLEDLLKLKGVGRKTANLVLGLGCNIPSVCVDTHVHRISNRIGLVNTNGPLKTEEELKKIFPKNYWIRLNTILVAFGQNVCLPVSPLCSRCRINNYCQRKGVKRFR